MTTTTNHSPHAPRFTVEAPGSDRHGPRWGKTRAKTRTVETLTLRAGAPGEWKTTDGRFVARYDEGARAWWVIADGDVENATLVRNLRVFVRWVRRNREAVA